MPETKTSSKTTSRLSDVRAQVGIIPIIRRNPFVYGTLAFILLFGYFLLPPAGEPSNSQMIIIFSYLILFVAWAVVIFTDELKPEWFKMITSISLIILGGWLFYRYSTGQWGQMTFLFFNMKIMKQAWPTMWIGLGVTVKIAIGAAIMSTTLGLLLAVFRSFNNRILNIFIICLLYTSPSPRD